MAQITSRKQLERWFKGKPLEWAQIIAARAALRVLPCAFTARTDDFWVEAYTQSMFHANAILWIAFNLPDHDIDDAVSLISRVFTDAADAARGAGRGAADAADAAREAIRALDDVVNADGAASAGHFSAEAAADAAYNDAVALDNTAYTNHHAVATAARAVTWANLSHDCDWLEDNKDINRLGRERLWPLGKPEEWDKIWVFGSKRLIAFPPPYNQNCSVWIDWYNRRVKGKRAAFDIPGDTNRTEDKKILARLTDASNEDFWNKSITYVNTTLQSWIDEARERAVIDYVASGAPLKLGSDAELAARDELASRLASVEAALAALKDQLASLTQTGHGGIGHNQPENATSLRDDEIITLKQQVKELETLVAGTNAALTQTEPDIDELVQLVPKLNRWGRMMQAVEDVTSPKVREGLETWAGPAALGAVGYLATTTIPNALAAFSHYFYTVWIPLLIG
jgi:hypothetical protein